MPGSTNTSTTTVVRESVESAPVLRYWEVSPCDGPADLYWSFAWEAVDSLLKTQDEVSDTQMGLLTDAVNMAVSVVLKAAHISDSWLPQYEAATAHLTVK